MRQKSQCGISAKKTVRTRNICGMNVHSCRKVVKRLRGSSRSYSGDTGISSKADQEWAETLL